MVGGGSKGALCSFPPAIPHAFIQEPSRAETEWASKNAGPRRKFPAYEIRKSKSQGRALKRTHQKLTLPETQGTASKLLSPKFQSC